MTTNKFTIQEQLSGFPVFQMVIIGFLRLSEPIAFTSMFPYIYFMIKHFDIAEDDAQISTYSGYLAASFSFSQFLSTVHWAKASNKYGRKTILLCGCAGTAFSMIIFGLSKNFYMALFARSLMGLLNGNVSIMRTTVGEIAHENRHQGLAFSNLSLLWSFGKCIGGWLGGVLTSTKVSKSSTTKLSRADEGLFSRYPFLLSNVVVAVLILIFIVIGWLFLEETHEEKKYSRDIGLEVGDALRRSLGFQVPERPWKSRGQYFEVGQPLLDEEMEDNSVIEMHNYPHKGKSSRVDISDADASQSETDTEAEHESIIPLAVRKCIISNFMCSFQNLIYVEFYPVLLAKALRVEDLKFPFHIKGGYGFSAAEIGKLLSITGLIGVVLVSLLFPVITKYCRTDLGFRIGLSINPIIYFFLPLYVFTSHKYNEAMPKYVTGLLLYLNSSVVSFANGITFAQNLILIHRASPKKQRALINSYAMTVTALARCAAPIIWGWIISKFDAQGYGGMSWWVLSVWSIMTFSHSLFIHETDAEET
ncbi:major facilitator superfamily [Scheffersomyces stipitis CBS 6054]|uniref:Major facilitator superfamily n=1 Tax=Scheffersomyces stipitis (strain ATCC 58785 / CBS 6054 / NBRC 10063 / NRRL Y-11545) TaxID=322104 RepID=A3LU73_PICST|nr:major facilitator superfamily [Scheffersomyces stipitis CBS 6054]ABN66193.2 major facilitator superfamily [Scheffersomyces stipitis CBS 6054]